MPEIRGPEMTAEDMGEMIAAIDGIAAKFKDDLMAKQRRRQRRIVLLFMVVGFLVGVWLGHR